MKEKGRTVPLGLAQKLYYDRMQEEGVHFVKYRHPWPFLEAMLQSKCLGYVDYALAGRLMGVGGISDESVAVLICHLSLASRRGHLCVAINANQIAPSPEEVWEIEQQNEDEERTPPEMMRTLELLIREGAEKLFPPLVCDVSSGDEFPASPICKDNDRYYLQRYWLKESGVINHIRSMSNGWRSSLEIDRDCVEKIAKDDVSSGNLLQEQAEGVIRACMNPLSFITGGPGTGKTYTAGILLKIVWAALKDDRKKNFSVAVAAPTGKAAANLEASLRRGLAGLEGFPHVKGQTLHQLLGIGRNFESGVEKDLSADVVIVDECSMIDVTLMKRLLGAVKPGSHLIMLGDRHQLASIEAGSLFSDLISHFRGTSTPHTCVTELTRCLRAELRDIVDFSREVKEGSVDEVLAYFNLESKGEGVRFIEFSQECTPAELQKKIVNYSAPLFPGKESSFDDPLALMREFLKFRLLTPMRQGPLGVEALNAAIHQAMDGRLERNGVRIIPVMITENDHSLELFNGEVGLVFSHNAGGGESDYALFPSRGNASGIIKVPLRLLPRYEMAYCMTVHKSQGSEFDHVLLVLGSGSEMFGREGLYTGVTRAKRSIEVWSRPEIIGKMIARQAVRRSGVVERLGK